MTVEERTERGKASRARAPRSSHGDWAPAPDRPDPVALLEEQAESRVPELVPIRHGRMSASPFAFFRGSAYIMAADLAPTPVAGARVQLCGDAHISNFGGFASPERSFVFSVNDFDETLPGPWEWDVKRFAASIAVAGRERAFPREARVGMVRAAVAEYRAAMRRFASMSTLGIWYSRVDTSDLREHLSPRARKQFSKGIEKARRKDSSRAFAKLATEVNGGARIVADPPLIVPVEDLVGDAEERDIEAAMEALISSYGETLPVARRHLLDRFRYAHFARKVVGVGSVGTRAWVVLMLGRDTADPLFLQAKEAQRSVLAPFLGESEFDNEGRRVVEGQHLMQTVSDIFLGWVRTPGIDGQVRDFYVRQLWDWKASADLGAMSASWMEGYARLCGWTLARAHARSGDSVEIAAYLGPKDGFDVAIAEFAERYADQNELDYAALLEAIDSGRLNAERGYAK